MQQEGGVYKAQGADTCVFIPQVDCAKKGKHAILPAPPGTELVSRITRDEGELRIQKVAVKVIKKLKDAGYDVSRFFNLATQSCVPEFKPSDERQRCTVRALGGDQSKLINLVTPKQGETLFASIRDKSKPDALIKTSLRDLMIAVARVNEEFLTQSDSHFNNLGWMGNQLVIFDWGRGTTDQKSFKRWVNQYLLIWSMDEREHWKTYSQHTLQFSLLDEMEKAGVVKKPGAYRTLVGVWDVLGLLGPARTHGIVSEARAKVFTESLFKWVTTHVNAAGGSTQEVIRLIPALFGDAPAIHPATADRPMPPAEANALVRIVPNPDVSSPAAPLPAPIPPVIPRAPAAAAVPPPAPVRAPPAPVRAPPAPPPAPVRAPPAPAAPAEDKKMTDIKNACRALLATGGTRRRRGRRSTLRR
jgi:hypothetical protein